MNSRHRSGIVGKEKAHSSAHLKEARSPASPPRTFWLKAWEEARGRLQHIDLSEGTLRFEGFTVQIPISLSSDLPSLDSLLGRKVRVLRTDSPSSIIVRSDDYQETSPTSSTISPPRATSKQHPQ